MGDSGHSAEDDFPVTSESGNRNGDGNGNGADSSYRVLEQYHSKPGHLRVITVGAGAAGLLVAYKMKKSFTNYDLMCYEKNPSVAGTWYENRYPGCACDVPAHAYTFAFEPNPDWSSFYAYGPEIRQYFENFAAKYELLPYIKLNSRVMSATWIEEKGIYEVEVESEGKKITDWCHVLINGTGFLNSWKWPAIEGLHDFKGQLLHSAAWDASVELEDKTVAVIGTGSSAIQLVPRIQKKAKHLTAFMRSVTWISPPVGDNVLEAAKAKSKDSAAEEKKTKSEDSAADEKTDLEPTQNKQYYYTDEDKKRFRDDPAYHLQYRKDLESAVNSLFEMYIANTPTSQAAQETMRSEMLRRIGPGHEELKERLIPSWPPGCRRITPGDGYLEALVQANVKTVHAEISHVTAEGLVDADGTLHAVDVLVCATGFNLAFAPSFDVRGVGGERMADAFADPEPRVYLAVAVPRFPNYFVVNGVRGNWAAGTALPSHEVQVEYILKCAARVQAEGIRALEVKMEPVVQLYRHIDEWHKRSVWNQECKSWYKNNIVGGKLWIWGGSALHLMKTMKDGVKWEHYDLRYKDDGNMWAYLGNGRVEAEVSKDMARLAPYMRNSDVSWTIE